MRWHLSPAIARQQARGQPDAGRARTPLFDFGETAAAGLEPVQYPQGAQSVPSARLSLAFVHLDGHHAGILGLQRPPPIAVTLRCDQRDSLGHPFIVGNAGAAEILESPQHVIVPPGRERETRPLGAALAISHDYLAGRLAAEEAALEKILLPAKTGFDHLPAASDGAFVRKQGFEHADGGVE